MMFPTHVHSVRRLLFFIIILQAQFFQYSSCVCMWAYDGHVSETFLVHARTYVWIACIRRCMCDGILLAWCLKMDGTETSVYFWALIHARWLGAWNVNTKMCGSVCALCEWYAHTSFGFGCFPKIVVILTFEYTAIILSMHAPMNILCVRGVDEPTTQCLYMQCVRMCLHKVETYKAAFERNVVCVCDNIRAYVDIYMHQSEAYVGTFMARACTQKPYLLLLKCA